MFAQHRSSGRSYLPLFAAGFILLGKPVHSRSDGQWIFTASRRFDVRLAELATSDGLTGLANRRHFDECLQTEWARAKRENAQLSLLLIDVDHFKKFNDTYGHQAGDACLQSIARVLEEQTRRPADLAARYGGEEFVVLLPHTDADGCVRIGEKIQEALRLLSIPHTLNGPTGCVTISAGGASIRPAERNSDSSSLVATADRALYKAKDDGRDRLVMSATVMAWQRPESA